MFRKTGAALLLAATMVMGSGLASAGEPSLHEVYQAAEAGRLGEAQGMMKQVLAAHPESGKAHYVEAELLAKQGQLEKASAELKTAERLAPGLPFARPEAVRSLRGLVGAGTPVHLGGAGLTMPAASSAAPALPWGMLMVGGLGLVAFILFASRLMSRRNVEPVQGVTAPAGSSWGAAAPAAATSYGGAPYGGGGWAPPAASAQEPGLGSRVLGGLATGAAVGAGMVAGEALMHRVLDGHSTTSDAVPAPKPGRVIEDVPPGLDLGNPLLSGDDMGGQDFGVSDAGSWDDGGGDGDWN